MSCNRYTRSWNCDAARPFLIAPSQEKCHIVLRYNLMLTFPAGTLSPVQKSDDSDSERRSDVSIFDGEGNMTTSGNARMRLTRALGILCIAFCAAALAVPAHAEPAGKVLSADGD